jgi:hypothetical protein
LGAGAPPPAGRGGNGRDEILRGCGDPSACLSEWRIRACLVKSTTNPMHQAVADSAASRERRETGRRDDSPRPVIIPAAPSPMTPMRKVKALNFVQVSIWADQDPLRPQR